MFSNIIVAIDGSDHAARAFEVALELTNKFSAELTLVHVLTHDHPNEALERMIEVEHLDRGAAPGGGAMDNGGSRIADTLAKHGMGRSGDREARVIAIIGEQIMQRAEAQAKAAGVKSVRTRVLTGDYANEILQVAEDVDADVIVMGRRGLSTLKGFVTGSVSHKVSQRADCSVLTVK